MQVVRKEHIQPGIVRYKGVVDEHLMSLFRKAGYEYTAYRFIDNRILLVFPDEQGAVLYDSKEELFTRMDLSSKSIN